MSATKTTSTTSTSTALTRPGTAPASGKKQGLDSGVQANAVKVNSKPWEDIVPHPDIQKEPREKTTLSVVLYMTRQEGGATLGEIKEAFGTMIRPDMRSHDPLAVIRFMGRERGWGFKMDKETGRVKLVAGKKTPAPKP